MRDLVLDCETTGISPAQGHRVIELACLDIETGEIWHWYFNPQRDVPADATKIHGITTAFLANKPLFADVAHGIRDVLAGANLIIHNAPFDIGFLNAEFVRLDECWAGSDPIDAGNVTCTLALARRKHPGAKNSLDALCDRYGIDRSARTKHNALVDCEILARVYVAMLGREQAAMDFVVNGSAEKNSSALVRPVSLGSRISREEEMAHAVFVASLGGNAIWSRYERAAA